MELNNGKFNPNWNKSTCKSSDVASSSSWVVDMSADNVTCKNNDSSNSSILSVDSKTKTSIGSHNISAESCFDSDSSDRSSTKFYIDLSSLPDKLTDTNENSTSKNIFSMYIDLKDNKLSVKEKPPRLSSSLGNRTRLEPKQEPKPVIAHVTKAKASFTKPDAVPSQQKDQFENFEELCNNHEMTISDILTISANKSDDNSKIGKKNESPRQTRKVLHKNKSNDGSVMSDSFVRLSDLDKPAISVKQETNDDYVSSSVNIRMTRSIPDSTWEMRSFKRSARSFHSENVLSLNRLFPHLKNEFSRSMPGSLSNRTRSPFRITEDVELSSDASEVSSMQSSCCRSLVGENSTPDDAHSLNSSLLSNCNSKFGQDLLYMFLEEIAPDVIVEASGRRFKAHTCVLSARCPYFALILSGGWVESAGNVIVLPSFSYNTVHFALCHIYSGLSTIPEYVKIVELATIADMLGLESLKEAIMVTLEANYCHHFHRPCNVCTAGVVQCLALSSVYGLEDIYRKCLKWITNYFHIVWPTEAFATLPKELVDRCYQQLVFDMTTENVLDTVCSCGNIEASLGRARWAETARAVCARLRRAAAKFMSARLCAVLRRAALLPAELPPDAARALDACFVAAIQYAPIEQLVIFHNTLSQVTKEIKYQPNLQPDVVSNRELSAFSRSSYLTLKVDEWRSQCELSYVRSAPRTIDTDAYQNLPHELKKRLQNLGCVVRDKRLSSSTNTTPIKMNRQKLQVESKFQETNRSRALCTTYNSDTRPPPSLNNSFENRRQRNNVANPPKVRTTKAQQEREKYNMTHNLSKKQGSSKSLNSRLNKFENTKSRYLEPKLIKDSPKGAGRAGGGRMATSCESSCNASPVQSRVGRAACSQDSLAATLSAASTTDSHSTNIYATYTKAKQPTHNNKTSQSHAASPVLAKKYLTKTKIPVYMNNRSSETVKTNVRGSGAGVGVSPPLGAARCDRRQSGAGGSLLSATKASAAKAVTRPCKEPAANKPTVKPNKGSQQVTPKQKQEIPVMERSGTFLKDEPTFGDKTTLIDVGE